MKAKNIPEHPKIKIDTCIHKLPTGIRINIQHDGIQQIIQRLSISEAAVYTANSKRTVKRYLKQNAYPIPFLQKLNSILSYDIFQLIENDKPLFVSKWKTVRLPSCATPQLAYFIGYLHGDGCVQGNKRKVSFVDEYKPQMKRMNLLSFELFGIYGKITNGMTPLSTKYFYRLVIESKILNSYLHGVFEMNQGKKVNLRIPKMFLHSKNHLKWYLRGLFDADGTLPKNPEKSKQLFIDITLKERVIIEQIREALNLFDITTLKPYCRIAKSPSSNNVSKTWELRIRRKKDIISFLKNVGFAHPDKEKRAKRILTLLGS